MEPKLTEIIAYKALQDFFKESPLVLFGTGPSCAVDRSFGMLALQKELIREVPKLHMNSEQRKEWEAVRVALEHGRDLESAMNEAQDPQLTDNITFLTGNFVTGLDRTYSSRLSREPHLWPATRLFEKLVAGLSSTAPVLHVLTPNYDMLAEYAWESAGIPYINGFVGGVCRRLNWPQSIRQVQHEETRSTSRRTRKITKQHKHIRLYKVHGSLNTFWSNYKVVENNAWMWSPPAEAERVMITPGVSKHEKITDFRNELLDRADEATEQSRAFLFIGYGFNDKHLERYIKPKLIRDGCKGLIVTRDSNSHIREVAEKAENFWVVCRAEKGEGSRIYNRRYEDWLCFPEKKLWDIAEFTTEILGD